MSLCKHRRQYQKTHIKVMWFTWLCLLKLLRSQNPTWFFSQCTLLIVIFWKTFSLIDNNLQTSLLADHWTLIWPLVREFPGAFAHGWHQWLVASDYVNSVDCMPCNPVRHAAVRWRQWGLSSLRRLIVLQQSVPLSTQKAHLPQAKFRNVDWS